MPRSPSSRSMPPRLALILSWSLLSIALSQAALISNVADIPKIKFDFIIIGSGASGNVVANRLSENPKYQILVLEAGPSNEGVLKAEIPFRGTEMSFPGPYSWNYTTVPQSGLGGRSVDYPRGHILGGSSSCNLMVYTRGSSEDFDRYAEATGDQGWSWNNMVPYFQKSERWTAPADNHNITGQFDPSIHGFKGEVGVSLLGFPTPIDQKAIDAANELGGKYAFNLDTNSGNQLGIGYIQNTIKGPARSSSATAYLAPQVLSRKNLHVVIGAQVSRVLQTSNGKVPAFRGVEFRTDSGGRLHTLTAKREVILSAGSIGTPQILLNSGIGNTKSLTALNIKPLVDLPDVGENLSDHALILNTWSVNGTDTYESLRNDPVASTKALEEWKVNKTGPYVANVVDHIGFFRLDDEFVPKNDTAAGPNTAHYELMTSNGFPISPGPPEGHYFTLWTIILAVSSRGSIKLRSNNPFDPVLIDPAHLKTDFDKLMMREALKTTLKFATASAWSGYIMEPFGAFADVNPDDDKALDDYINQNTGAGLHGVGTASMSPKGAKYGVVDPDLKVKKVEGLRVVDASVLPFVPSAHTQAPAYVVGERASDLIKASYA